VAKSGEAAALPLVSLLILRRPRTWLRSRWLRFRPLAPARYKSSVGSLGLRDEGTLGISQGLDVVIPCSTRCVAAALRRHPGFDLHLPQFGLVERRPSEGLILALCEQVPNENRDLAGGRNNSDLLSTPCFSRSRHQHRREAFDRHALKSNRREECVGMRRKNGQIGPLTTVRAAWGVSGRPHLVSGFQAIQKVAIVYASWGVIWRIPV
jgi:hypothetical protein